MSVSRHFLLQAPQCPCSVELCRYKHPFTHMLLHAEASNERSIVCTLSLLAKILHEWCDFENRVRVRSRSLEITPFDRSHTSSYSPSIVTGDILYTDARQKASDFNEIFYTAADFELDEPHMIKNEKFALDRLPVAALKL